MRSTNAGNTRQAGFHSYPASERESMIEREARTAKSDEFLFRAELHSRLCCETILASHPDVQQRVSAGAGHRRTSKHELPLKIVW